MPSKSQKYHRQVKQDRDDWRESQPNLCMVCESPESWPPLQVHEIERKSGHNTNWGHRCNYLVVCQQCHAGPIANMSHARQLAIKLRHDPLHFNLGEWLSIKPRPEAYVTMSDVQDEYRKLYGELYCLRCYVDPTKCLRR